jgi:hypothetical protein
VLVLRGSLLALILGLMVPLQAEPPAVSSCGLARDAVRLDGQQVKLRGTAVASGEQLFVFDAACNSADSQVLLVADCSGQDGCAPAALALGALETAGDRAARFDVELTGRVSSWDGVGYGPDGRFPLQLEVDEVALARRDDDLPGPDQLPRAAAPRSDAVRALRAADAALCSALAAGDRGAVESLTTEEYVFGADVALRRREFLEQLSPLCDSRVAVACEAARVNVHRGLGFVLGFLYCRDAPPIGYSQTYSATSDGWRALRGAPQLSPEAAAAEVFRQATITWDRDHEWREATLAQLSDRQRAAHEAAGRSLAEAGFEELGVIEDLTLARLAPETPTISAGYAGDDGSVLADVAVAGEVTFVSFTSELLDGRVLVTSNIEVDVLTPPPGWDKRRLPSSTPIAAVLAEHRARVDRVRASPSELLRVAGFADAIEASRRRFSIVRRHRRALGYLTRSELEALTARRELRGEALDLFWAEFQRLVAAPSPAD